MQTYKQRLENLMTIVYYNSVHNSVVNDGEVNRLLTTLQYS